jgi:hypothetical protein
MTCGRQIDDREPAMAEYDATVGIPPKTFIVRAPMCDRVSHGARMVIRVAR